MKKAVLVEPKLLAEVKRKSPAVYEFYRNSPPMRFNFVEYGLEGHSMFIQKEALDCIEALPEREKYPIEGLIGALQIGYILGNLDMKKRFPGDNSGPMQGSILIGVSLNLATNYPAYYMEDLLNAGNYDKRDGFLYSTLSYKESQYFIAWEIIFSRHEDFNPIFELLNEKREREDLDNMGIIDFSSFYN